MENIPTVHFNPGEVIFNEGDPSNTVYLIISGTVEISTQKGVKKIVLATQQKNTIFGEINIIDGKRRSATATATSDTFCYKCNTLGIIHELTKANPKIKQIMRHLALVIREKNKELKSSMDKDNLLNQFDIIQDDEPKQKIDNTITKETILNDKELQKSITEMHPILQSIFKVLFATAYKK